MTCGEFIAAGLAAAVIVFAVWWLMLRP